MRAFRLSQLCLSTCDLSGVVVVVVVVMTPCMNASARTPHHCLRARETSIPASFRSPVLFLFSLHLKRAFSHTFKSIRKKKTGYERQKEEKCQSKGTFSASEPKLSHPGYRFGNDDLLGDKAEVYFCFRV